MSNPVTIMNLRDGVIAEFSSAKEAESACAEGNIELHSGVTYFIATVHKVFVPEIKFSLKDVTAEVLKLEAKQAAKLVMESELSTSDVEISTENSPTKRRRGPNKPKESIEEEVELPVTEVYTEPTQEETNPEQEEVVDTSSEEELDVPPNFMDVETDLEDLNSIDSEVYFE